MSEDFKQASHSQDAAKTKRPGNSVGAQKSAIPLGAVLPVALFGAVAGVFFIALFWGNPGQLPSALIGKPVPSFNAPPVTGVTTRSGTQMPGFSNLNLAEGELTLVNVWATWCASCRLEHPVLMTLKKRLGVRVYGIDYKDDDTSARRYLNVHGNPYEKLGKDDQGRIAIELGVYGVPETFLIDHDGKVLLRHPGPVTEDIVQTLIKPAIVKANRKAKVRPATNIQPSRSGISAPPEKSEKPAS